LLPSAFIVLTSAFPAGALENPRQIEEIKGLTKPAIGPVNLPMFIQENIEQLKRDWTDKYVVVAEARPELRRFEGYTGQVKTVNMSGRALVQFDAWNNIGWYDIELGYLQQVPKPDPEMAGKRAEPVKAASGQAKPAAVEGKAAAKPAAAKPGGKMSVADILAAARVNKTGDAAPAASTKPAATKEPAPAAKPAKAAPAGEAVSLPKGQRPSVAEMLAYCRQHDAQG
jgi:hypothetical protein